jgi:hypothetical protein
LTLGTRAERGEITTGRQHTAMAVPLAGAPREAAAAASFPLEALGQPDHGAIEPGPQPPAVVEVDVDAFVADPTITVDGEQVTVTLPKVSVRTLLDDGPLLARIERPGRTREVIITRQPVPAPTAAPVADYWVVEDMAAFLANPVVASTAGGTIRVPLSKEAVQALRTGSTTRVTLGAGELTVIPGPTQAVARNAMRWGDDSGGQRLLGGRAVGEGGQASIGFVGPGRVSDGAEGVLTKDSPTLDPVLPQRNLAVTLFLPWEQTWTLRGYTRGRLVQSIGLGPQEETTIEIFSWDRQRRALEQTATAESEQFGETTDTTRDASSVYSQLQADKEFELQSGGALKVTYKRGDMLTVEANGSINATNKEKLSDLSKHSQERLQESVIRASTRVKASRTTKITETRETGREDRVTRKLKNTNRCHALTINYFDVHAAYDIVTRFLPGEARICVLLDNPVAYAFGDDDELTVRSHESVLRGALLDQALLPGFDALRVLEARRQARTLLEQSEIARQLQEDQHKLADHRDGAEKESAELKTARTAVTDLLGKLATAATQLQDADVHTLMKAVDERPEAEWRPKMEELGTAAQRWLFKRLLRHAAQSLLDALEDLIDAANLLVQAPALLAAINSNTTLNPDTLLSPTDDDVDDLLQPVFQQYAGNGFEWNWWGGFFKDNSLRKPNDAGLLGLLTAFRRAYSTLLSAQQKASQGGDGDGKQHGEQRIDTLTSEDRLEMAFPVLEAATAMERAGALMAHLREFRNYYNYAILMGLPTVELLERLSAPLDAQAIKVGMFEPRIVAMRGKKVAIPLLVDASPKLQDLMNEIIGEVAKTDEATRRVTIPTAGVVTDLRLGECSGCEEQLQREQDTELRARAARIALDELEAKRRQARLDQKPPDLGPTEPVPTGFVVHVEQPTPPAP